MKTHQKISILNIGKISEEFIARILQLQGLTIIARNIRIKSTELDIIAAYKDCLYIIEVRARHIVKDRVINNSNISIHRFINLRKIFRVSYATYLVFRLYSNSFKISCVVPYLAIVIWEKSRIIRFTFLKMESLI